MESECAVPCRVSPHKLSYPAPEPRFRLCNRRLRRVLHRPLIFRFLSFSFFVSIYLFLLRAHTASSIPFYVYVPPQKITSFVHTKFFNREKGKTRSTQGKKRMRKKEKGKEDPCSLTMARQMPALFHSPPAPTVYTPKTGNNIYMCVYIYRMQEVTYPVRSIARGGGARYRHAPLARSMRPPA